MKRKSLFIIFGLFAIITSCKNTNPNAIPFGSNQEYILDQNKEKTIAITQELADEFKLLSKSIKAQIPLNKVIESDNYKAFIGIPLKANSKKIIESLKNDNTFSNVRTSKQTIKNISVQKALITTDSISSFHLCYDIEQSNSSFLIIFASKDSTMVASKFKNENFIKSKIKFE